MNDLSMEMAILARKIINDQIDYQDAIQAIEKIEQKYGPDAFPPVGFNKKEKPWDAAYMEDLEMQSMSGACSKEFFLHLAEVRRELNRQRRSRRMLLIGLAAAIAAIVAILAIILSTRS